MQVFILLMVLMMSADDHSLLEAHYTAVQGSDPEYAQGAIERNDLPHREIVHFFWLIEVPAPADPAEWQRRLNAAVDRRHGSFRVQEATPEEERAVKSGEIRLQH